VRLATSLLLTAGLVVSLAACSTTEPEAATDCTPVGAGAVSDAIDVSGELGSLPIVVFDSPLTAETTERTVSIAGDGDIVRAGDTVDVHYSILNGSTGVNIAGTDYTDATLTELPVDEAQFLPGIVKTIECSTVGSRVVGVIPPVDAFGDQGSTQLGLGATDDMVFVADIIAIEPPADPALPKADGEDQPAEAGFPTVVLDDTGRPTVTIPDEAPPTELKMAVLKKGDGAEVAAGNDVIVHYEGINWNTKVIFDESWARGEPATFNTNAVIPGFSAAIFGQNVGSQVIVIVPPDQGYGEAGSPPAIGGTDTLVFVVDILGIG
jgi:peptidylprolyl isomerase